MLLWVDLFKPADGSESVLKDEDVGGTGSC